MCIQISFDKIKEVYLNHREQIRQITKIRKY